MIAIKNGTVIDPMPAGNYVFGPEDHIVVIGKSTDVFQLSSQTTVIRILITDPGRSFCRHARCAQGHKTSGLPAKTHGR
ncbi:MAG: hypothetical protein V8R67_08235 [Eubacterium sp.]